MAKKVLKVQKYIRENGLDALVKEFNLKTRDYENKVLIKYDQIASSMGFDEVQACRGLILEKGSWNVLCLSFEKFFNAEEGHASKIDWNTAKILEKCDGSMIQLYWDWNKEEWFAATTGTGEGEGEVNNKLGTTFNSLFWKIAKEKYGLDVDFLVKGHVYVFELMTPYNIVVTPHNESKISLLAVRNLKDLSECNYDAMKNVAELLGVPLVKAFDMNVDNVGAIKNTFDGMPFIDEGYVVVDGNFNRIKIKNPAYVAVHHLKSKTSESAIMEVVKSNEIEEFAATFPDRKEEIFKLYENYIELKERLEGAWYLMEKRRPKNITPKEKKRYAMEVFETVEKDGLDDYKSMFFLLSDGKVDSVSEYLRNYDNKRLYKVL